MHTKQNKIDTKDDFDKISQRLQYVMETKQLNQKKMSKIAGVSEQTVYRWMRKDVFPSRGAIIKIAEYTGISSLWIEEGKGPIKGSALWGYQAGKVKFTYEDLCSLYDRINEILTANGITPERLAALANLGQISTDSDWWIGDGRDRVPSTYDIQKIADATGYNRDWIWYGKGNRLSEHSKSNDSRVQSQKHPAESTITATTTDDIEGNFNMPEMVKMTMEVLQSETVYRSALASDIRAFHAAVKGEEEKGTVREVIAAQRTEIQALTDTISLMQKQLVSLGATEAGKKKSHFGQ